MKKGKVYLVGAGPGDPGLITVKGLECIQTADVVIYDYLASSALLGFARPEAEIVYVGKKGGDHTLPQAAISALIAAKAAQGLTVTRLKGGDPFIFGRGGEEAEVLVKEQIPFEIVPGVTSAIAAPAYAGIPLTHRDHTSTLAFVTGHENPEKRESSINWPHLAEGIGTLVFLMGVKNLPNIVHNLTTNGMSPETPIALVRWGTTSRQVTVSGTLDTIVEQVAAAGLKAPAIIVVGDVVKLRNQLQWFEKRPLFGKKIVVTRAREQASDLVQALNNYGADCLQCPTIKISPMEDSGPLDEAVQNIEKYDWLIFTSVNGVNFFFKHLFANNRDARSLGRVKTASIGPATAARLSAFGISSDIIPDNYRAESVVEAFSGFQMKGLKVLLPRAKEARPILPAALKKMGALVDEISAYQTLIDDERAKTLLNRLTAKEVDLITFTSSSTVKNFMALLPSKDFNRLIANIPIACIGPITADTAREAGLHVRIVAETFTIPGLCDAILQYFSTKQS